MLNALQFGEEYSDVELEYKPERFAWRISLYAKVIFMEECGLRLLHVSLIVSNIEKAALFYEGVLGLMPDKRPDLGFEGLFYKLGEGIQLHLLCVENPYQHCKQPTHGGRDRHIALAVSDIKLMQRRLEKVNIDYTLSQSGRAALFCHDEDGNVIELCETKEASAWEKRGSTLCCQTV